MSGRLRVGSWRQRCAVASMAASLMTACGTAPPPRPPAAQAPAAAAETPRPATPFEQALRERALSQGRQGRLADAAVSWEVLGVLRPDDHDVRERFVEIRALIDAALPERLQRAAQALKRGDLDTATTQYLAALALQPDHAAAADALRGIERERSRRSFLRKPSRPQLAQRPASAASAGRPASTADRNDIEHASLLGTQGDFDAAIALIEHHLAAANRRDPAFCRLLADAYVQQGEKLLPRDRAAAIASFEKGLRADASNSRAATRLSQLSGRPPAAIAAARPPVDCIASR